MSGSNRAIIISALLIFVIAGCATERHIEPAINSEPRRGLALKTPLLASVLDGRTDAAESDAASKLKAELTRLYGSNIRWIPYFQKTPPGRVALRIRIMTLGSKFGSRLISTSAYAHAVDSAHASATGPLGSAVATGTSSADVFAASLSGEGWWNGGAWVDVAVNDLRGVEPVRFTIPIAAEDREPNIWGYKSGDKAAERAWNQVSAQLTKTLDEIMRAMQRTNG